MKKLMVHIERCAGCKRCELECMAEHSKSKNYIYGFINGEELKTRIFVESINDRPVPIVCRHCKEPLCVSACISGVMKKNTENGFVNNEENGQKCVGCWMCIMACPYGVINPSFETVERDRIFPKALKCDFCPEREIPACVSACPNEVIEVVDVEE